MADGEGKVCSLAGKKRFVCIFDANAALHVLERQLTASWEKNVLVLRHQVSCSCSEGETSELQNCLPHKTRHLVGEEMFHVTVESGTCAELMPTRDGPAILPLE